MNYPVLQGRVSGQGTDKRNMNYIDIILIIPIIWFSYQGFKKGFIIELASLIALILGIYAALYFSGHASGFLINNFDIGTDYIPVVSFIITFIAVVFLVYLIGKILEKLVNMIALGFINRLAGGIFGLLKGAVLLSIVLLIINHFNDELISSEKKKGSFLYPPVEWIAPTLWNSLKKLNDPTIEKFKDTIEETDI